MNELDHLNPLPSCSNDECSCNLTQKFYKLQQNQRLTQFLMKLDSKYTQMRSTILMMPELLTIAQAYQILDQEQRHQHLSKLNDSHYESLAFNADTKPYFEKPKPSVLVPD